MSSHTNNDRTPSAPDTPLVSTLANDPDMAELIEFFVTEINDRIDSIASASEQNDLGQLRTVAHQLKGAATGYGFAPISDSAANLEQLIDTSGPATEVDHLREQVDELINLCQRVSL